MKSVVEREVLEETGLTITDARPFGFASNPNLETFEFPNGDMCQFFVLNFFARTFAGELVMRDGESLALGWFDTADLPEMLPNMKASLAAYDVFRATGEFQMI